MNEVSRRSWSAVVPVAFFIWARLLENGLFCVWDGFSMSGISWNHNLEEFLQHLTEHIKVPELLLLKPSIQHTEACLAGRWVLHGWLSDFKAPKCCGYDTSPNDVPFTTGPDGCYEELMLMLYALFGFHQMYKSYSLTKNLGLIWPKENALLFTEMQLFKPKSGYNVFCFLLATFPHKSYLLSRTLTFNMLTEVRRV